MARIVIAEPSGGIRDLLGIIVTELGHKAVSVEEADPFVDLVLVEPADGEMLAAAISLRARRPDLPLVFVSTVTPSCVTGLEGSATVMKPFRLAELEAAIERALSTRET